MTRVFFGMVAFVAGVALMTSPAVSQPPGGKDGKGGKGDKGGKGMPFELGQVFPPPLMAELNLTPAQLKELDAIKADLKTKLDKLLTAEQKKTIEDFRPMGKGGDMGGKGGDKGGKGGDKGAKGGDKGGKGEGPDRPGFEKAPPPVEKKGEKKDPTDEVSRDATPVQWFATLDRGLAEAKRTGKPILFVSAAPHCAGVSGMW